MLSTGMLNERGRQSPLCGDGVSRHSSIELGDHRWRLLKSDAVNLLHVLINGDWNRTGYKRVLMVHLLCTESPLHGSSIALDEASGKYALAWASSNPVQVLQRIICHCLCVVLPRSFYLRGSIQFESSS